MTIAAATSKQVSFIRDLSKELYGDEYEAQRQIGLSPGANLTKKLTIKQASEMIEKMLAEKAEREE